MAELTSKRSAHTVNTQTLDDDLRETFGALISGVSTGPYGVRVHLATEATEQQRADVLALLEAHDPAKLSAKEAARLARRETIETNVSETTGIEADKLTAKQRDGLLLALLYRAGAINETGGTIKPFDEWL